MLVTGGAFGLQSIWLGVPIVQERAMTDGLGNISHVFAGNTLDRGERERRDEQWIIDKANDPVSVFLPMADLKILITEGPDHSLVWLSLEDRRGTQCVHRFRGKPLPMCRGSL